MARVYIIQFRKLRAALNEPTQKNSVINFMCQVDDKLLKLSILILDRCANIRENTIASLQKAAEHGADFVEFDVQLSKDLVPVLFHDFHVNIGLHQKAKKGGELTTLQIPVKDLTLNQLHELKVN